MSGRNIAQSVRDRLLHRSRKTGENYQALLTRYALERLLYRLSTSDLVDLFILKGAYAFLIWHGEPHRPTKDIDLLGYGSAEALASVFRTLCAVEEVGDGVTFDASTVRSEETRDRANYDGMRIRLDAYMGSARIPLQIDVGFGDAVTPPPERATFPTLLEDMDAPRIRCYPRETVIAEKVHAITTLGITNTRMKDFYDVDYLARHFAYQGAVLANALKSTFARRDTPLPDTPPVALTTAFADDREAQQQWQAFGKRLQLKDHEADLGVLVHRLQRFIGPLLRAADDDTIPERWEPGGPWQ